MIFVDTNYFLRFILKDNNTQHLQAKKLFLAAAKEKVELVSSTVVFFEIHFVLKSFYGKDKLFLIEILSRILNLNVIFPEKHLLQTSLRLYGYSNLGLEDCYNIIFARIWGVKDFRTFDAKLDKIAKDEF